MAAITTGLDCILIGMLLNLMQSAWIVYRWVLMVGLTVGLMLGSTVGSMVGHLIDFSWPCRAIDLSKSFDSSDERLLRLSAKRVLRAIIIVTNPLKENPVRL
jgi:hypothetical protein